MTLETLTFVKDLTLGGWAILVLLLGARRWWYYGHAYDALQKRLDEMEEDRDRFLNMALRADAQAESATNVGERLANSHLGRQRRGT